MSHEHVSNTKRIWTVFGLLSLITTVEVAFGIIRPAVLAENAFVSMSLLNWLFIILTLVKAYYIVWAFMHMEGEKKVLKNAVVLPLIFLVCYLIFILLTEGDYVFEVFRNSTIKWNF
ncbi:cytochrome C oxidase subunit IV family protein [Flavobacterium gilvum]|uniref:Cytochrome C oxidase subunit IV n=1 Tax=Flavobacterium gilvum TaxID=1492737 RepID=A0AAC9I257_9FLAO|nr:cytochrome C oxidase subunit IV family protein [Flavobacterium gilvum]AOW09174.1 cytochrome C oxidase subunit IV [Flavobacterium gilvum]KFC59226.1 cytochrome C oxidase subunit IV [Flavobacterium gilvum]